MHIKRENETEKERERSVFSTVFLALVAVLAVEIAMLLLSFTLSGFPSRLNSNAEQILDKQVVNRAAYISGQLIEAQDLSDLDSAVNRAAAQLVQEGETVASLTSSNEKSTPLFDEVSGQMVRTLREKNVTGVYIVLHTGEISRTAGGSLPARPRPVRAGLRHERRSAVRARAGGGHAQNEHFDERKLGAGHSGHRRRAGRLFPPAV